MLGFSPRAYAPARNPPALSRFRVTGSSQGRPPSPHTAFDDAVRAAFERPAPSAGGARATAKARRALRRLGGRWLAILRRLAPLGAVSTGNRIDVYTDGDALFEALWSAIDQAAERVFVTTYILRADRVGCATLAALARAAERGCAVTLRYDAVGSQTVACPELEDLRRLGGRIEEFNPFLTWRSRLSRRLVRDHRKVAVVDGRVAFCGGMNLSEEYAGERHGTAEFRDTHLRIEGPAARDLEELFEEERGRAPAALHVDAPGPLVQVLESNRWRRRRAIQHAMRRTIARSERRVWLSSPYFVPPRRLARAIRGAARRGVDVRLLTAGYSDVPLARAIGRHLYAAFLRRGVRIFEMNGRVLHGKTAVIDGVYASVGSFNLDTLSDRYNHEVNVGVLDHELAEALERDFERSLEQSAEVTEATLADRGWFERLFGWLGYEISRLL
jgi:cardiolipin synthase